MNKFYFSPGALFVSARAHGRREGEEIYAMHLPPAYLGPACLCSDEFP